MGATELWLVRHGESSANVAQVAAHHDGSEVVEVDARDADIPLTEKGELQAAALGQWLADRGDPIGVWSSPYVRARRTVEIALESAGRSVPIRLDERLRDREQGVLDLLTAHGADIRYPEEVARRDWHGKFYYRPPGGESWADIALRIRSFLGDIDVSTMRGSSANRAADAGAGPVLIAAHDAVVMLILYVCLELTEERILDFADANDVGNASITRLSRPSGVGVWRLDEFSHDDHLEDLDDGEAGDAPHTADRGDEQTDRNDTGKQRGGIA